MGFRITISDNDSYLVGKVDEPITREIIIQLTKEYIKLIKTTGINRILSDFRGAPNVMGTLQDYEFAYTDVKHLGLPRNIRVAVVTDVGDTTHDFPETLALNVGYLVEIFHSFDQAVEWLLEDTR